MIGYKCHMIIIISRDGRLDSRCMPSDVDTVRRFFAHAVCRGGKSCVYAGSCRIYHVLYGQQDDYCGYVYNTCYILFSALYYLKVKGFFECDESEGNFYNCFTGKSHRHESGKSLCKTTLRKR